MYILDAPQILMQLLDASPSVVADGSGVIVQLAGPEPDPVTMRDLVCVMCGIKSVLCAGLSLCYVGT